MAKKEALNKTEEALLMLVVKQDFDDCVTNSRWEDRTGVSTSFLKTSLKQDDSHPGEEPFKKAIASLRKKGFMVAQGPAGEENFWPTRDGLDALIEKGTSGLTGEMKTAYRPFFFEISKLHHYPPTLVDYSRSDEKIAGSSKFRSRFLERAHPHDKSGEPIAIPDNTQKLPERGR